MSAPLSSNSICATAPPPKTTPSFRFKVGLPINCSVGSHLIRRKTIHQKTIGQNDSVPIILKQAGP